MGKADRFTDTELEYIKAVYPQLGPTEISRRLGRSLSAVKARIKQLGLKSTDIEPFEVKVIDPQNTYERLIELRDVLRKRMTSAPPNCIAGICKEYRATLVEIEKIENSNHADDENPLAQIAKAIADGMQS